MSKPPNWTTPAQLRQQVKRFWDNGEILESLVTAEIEREVSGESGSGPLFPLRLPIRGPTSAQLGLRFDDARRWAASLRAMPKVRIEEREVRHQLFGANSLPRAAWLDDIEDAVALLGKADDFARFMEIYDAMSFRQPKLLVWLYRRPLVALGKAGNWDGLLDVVNWLLAHPRPDIYIRQMDIPGVHSKFVEKHRAVFIELLDYLLPSSAIDFQATGVRRFERRYGFRTKPERIRFRVLDPALALFRGRPEADIELDADTFASLETGVSRVFALENEINFLAFPDVTGGMAIFGAGYGFESLAKARWINSCKFYYWGDIDTHGFAILDQLRAHFPHAESLLMDRETLLASRNLWGREDKPVERELPRLNAAERALYDDLRGNRIGDRVRLEQERIGFERVKEVLEGLHR